MSSETGPEYAWRMPREYRQWWIQEIQKERQELEDIRAGVKKRPV